MVTHGPVPTPSVLLALQRTTHATLHALLRSLGGLDLVASEMNVLANLADDPAPTLARLGAAVGTRPSTLTSVVDRLEARGLVTRGGRADDRRAVVVSLTGPGRAAALRVRGAIDDLETRALATVSDESVDAFRSVLAAFARASE